MTQTMTNLLGKTLTVGQKVTHYDGWTGTITSFNEARGLVFVQPDDMTALPQRDCYALNEAHRERTGKAEFCRPRDHGLTMGNYREACE